MSDQNFAEFRAKLVQLGADLDKSSKRIVSQMANTGLAVTKKNTPVGKYSEYVFFYTEWGKPVQFKTNDEKVGGTLRKGWHKDRAFKVGRDWQSGYTNNVDYVTYVNNGHRIVSRWGETTGYVKGKRMLEQGMNAAKQQTGAIMQDEIDKVKQKGGW